MKDIIKEFEEQQGTKFIGRFGDGLFFIDNIGCPFTDDAVFIYDPSAKYGFHTLSVRHPDWWDGQLRRMGVHLNKEEQNALLKTAITAISGEVRTA
ncbi:hypothetical protein [uncultured Mitsuokella sp.]|uniref:hypothetical protein n=1 Tax=uncultured Mitsuokella sp. TaxID=453120 RepID=UPI0026DB42B9|nr:hypothetical protein [uncultured Mitsuokella sp.]